MDTRNLANKLITNFGALLTLPDLRLDEQSHSCVLLFDGDIVLNVEFDDASGQFILSTYLDELPRDSREAALRELMIANLYWHRTDGATLGLEDATDGVVLAQARAVTELDDGSFEKLVEGFVNQAERWKKRMAELKTEGSGASLPPQHSDRHADGPRIFG